MQSSRLTDCITTRKGVLIVTYEPVREANPASPNERGSEGTG
jgi:hypothetical protein